VTRAPGTQREAEEKGGALVARRVDPSGSFSEEAGFFGPPSERLFGVLHRPTDRPRGGVVICPSIYGEFVTGYRIDVSIARLLASRGVAVQRFHYRGLGHSDGQADDMTFATMRADTLAAAERLAKETGVAGPAFLGTRFGAVVAASAAGEHPGGPLAFLDPTLEARAFFREAWRAGLIRDVKEGTSRQPGQGLAQALEQEETVDVLGYAICRPLFESASGRSVLEELGDGARRILFVQPGRASSVRADFARAAEALRERGCEVDVELVDEDLPWWFLPGPGAKQPTRRVLVEAMSAWLERELTGARA
jgi:alpha/beta superfamily hydrolase